MASKKIRTIHPLDVVASIQAQNEAVGLLLATVESTLTIAGDALPSFIRDPLRIQVDACRAAMWPDPET